MGILINVIRNCYICCHNAREIELIRSIRVCLEVAKQLRAGGDDG